jgi:tetratricopeptide (TPR) repeat protein
VQDAAVLGQSFTTTALAAVSGDAEEVLEPRLRGLVRRELLALEADPRSPERGQYAFVQALIREVAYNTLARADRKSRHLAAARYFESLGSEELVGALAGHYLAAHASASEGPEADALAGQARIALRAAADRAAALGANEQAVMFLEQALTVTVDPAEAADLLERAGDAATLAGRHENAIGLLERALARRRELADRRGIIRAAGALSRATGAAYRVDAAQGIAGAAVAEFADMADDPAYIELLAQFARVLMVGEQHREAMEAADRALASAERLDLVPTVIEALTTRGSALMSLGHSYEGLACLRGAIALADERGLTFLSLAGRSALLATLGTRDPAVAVAEGRTAIVDTRRLGLRGRAIANTGNVAESVRWTGDWDWALGELQGWLASDLEPGDREWLLVDSIVLQVWRGEDATEARAELEATATEATFYASMDAFDLAGLIALAEGRLSDVREAMHQVAGMSPLNAPGALPVAARAAIWARDPRAAAEDLAALAATGAHGRFISLREAAIRAGIAALEGRTGEARASYVEVVRALEERGVRFEAALAGIDMATVLDPNLPDVREAIDHARAVLVELGAVPFLKLLDERVAEATGREDRPAARAGAPAGATPSTEGDVASTASGSGGAS